MLDISDLRFGTVFSAAPGLAAAVRSLDVTPPAVSQRLALHEDHLRPGGVERGPLRLTAEEAFR